MAEEIRHPFQDNLTRFVFEHAAVRGAVVSLDSTYRDILACHPYPLGLARLLGEALAAVCLSAHALKSQGRLIFQLQGTGQLRLLVVECDASLKMRAVAQWDGTIPDDATLAQLAGDPGSSRLAVTLDPRDGGPLYQGIVSIEGSSVAELFEHYLAKSEQIDSRVRLAVLNDRACGVLLQRMPDVVEVDANAWRRAAATIESVVAVFAARDTHTLLSTLFREDDVRVFAGRTPQFGCSCSRERVVGVLRLLGSEEVDSIVAERGSVDVDCEFCNRHYRFEAAEAWALFPDSPSALARH